jgi:predicted nucleic acid-binding Zn ribbon protein
MIAMQRAGRVIGSLKSIRSLADPELRARAAWTVAAGETIAHHTRAVSLVRGSLVVEVNDYIWQRQLTPLRKSLLENLEKTLGEKIVTDIDFRPMPMRRAPQRAETARRSSEPASERAGDPVLDLLYQQSRRKSIG